MQLNIQLKWLNQMFEMYMNVKMNSEINWETCLRHEPVFVFIYVDIPI